MAAVLVREQDYLDVYRPIQNVQDGNAISADAVEDQVSTMHPATEEVVAEIWTGR